MKEIMTKETLGWLKCHWRDIHNQSLLQVTVISTFIKDLCFVAYGKIIITFSTQGAQDSKLSSCLYCVLDFLTLTSSGLCTLESVHWVLFPVQVCQDPVQDAVLFCVKATWSLCYHHQQYARAFYQWANKEKKKKQLLMWLLLFVVGKLFKSVSCDSTIDYMFIEAELWLMKWEPGHGVL